MEPFSIIDEAPESQLFDKFLELTSGLTAAHDIQYQATLKKRFPELSVTAIPTTSCNLLGFAASGNATAELDTSTDPVASWRGYLPKHGRNGRSGIVSTTFFAKYLYKWSSVDYTLFVVGGVQYLLKEPDKGESIHGPLRSVDALIGAAGSWLSSNTNAVWVFDGSWRKDTALWESVAKTTWDEVILDEILKRDLQEVAAKFFDSEDVYKDLGIPWERGLIFHGPPGNGKNLGTKALMRTLHDREKPVPSLYVKSAISISAIRNVFRFARIAAPCLLVFEDIETIVTPSTRSYFLSQVDGLEGNDGILMVASTNFIEQLDPGITKRPSRFDRRYRFLLPNKHERTLYAECWRRKVLAHNQGRVQVDFPELLCPAMADITDDFLIAYMQEAFISSLLTILRENADAQTPEHIDGKVDCNHPDCDHPECERYKLWQVFKNEVRVLRYAMDSSSSAATRQGETIAQGAPIPPHSLVQRSQQEAATSASNVYDVPYVGRSSEMRAHSPVTFARSHTTSAFPGIDDRSEYSSVAAGFQVPTFEPALDLPGGGPAGSKVPRNNGTAVGWASGRF